jgi:hypothetical protein
MIPDCVDFTIFMLLRAIDQGVLQLKFVNNDGELVDLEAAGKGELGGMFMDSDGWRARYSKTRFVDDFKDM